MLECVYFFPENETYILLNNLDFHFAMFNIYLYFQISIIATMHVPVWLLLKKKCTDSKTKLEALFFPFTKPGFCIYTLEFE